MSFTGKIQKVRPSWIIVLVFVAVTWINFNQELWKGRSVISNDVAHYYSYLPVVFYEHDLSQDFLKDTVNTLMESRYYAPKIAPNGNHVIKMSMGMAATYLPFFVMAHVYTAITKDRGHGFSEPYHFAVQFSSLFYFLAGLFFLANLLRLFFSNAAVALTLFCITFGTNALYYLTIGSGMSHAANFGLIAAFLYYSVAWHNKPGITTALIIGCLGGLITLIRPINILIYVFFFLYDIRSLKDLSAKIKLLGSNTSSIIIMAACGILFFLPQLLYWKAITGVYFFNSYVGEHFYFAHPQLINGLFSFRKGWLLYTPIMFFALAGICFLRKELKPFFIPVVFFLAVYLYVVFSWWCWWYGGSYGQRALIDIYPLLAIPFAAMLVKLKEFSKTKKNIAYVAICLLVLLNLFQTIQAKYNIIHYDSMTKENYMQVWFQTTKDPEREKYLRHPDYEKAMRGEKEY